MAIKKINMTLWTDKGTKAEFKGGVGSGQDALIQVLSYTGDAVAREKALVELQKAHQQMREWETRREAAKNG